MNSEALDEIWERAEAALDNDGYATALDLYQRLEDSELTQSLIGLGEMRREGWGVVADGRRAWDYFPRVIAAGNAEGFRATAELYRYGAPGLPRDLVQAEAYEQRTRRYLS